MGWNNVRISDVIDDAPITGSAVAVWVVPDSGVGVGLELLWPPGSLAETDESDDHAIGRKNVQNDNRCALGRNGAVECRRQMRGPQLIAQRPALPWFALQWLVETHALIPGTVFVR